MTPQLESAIAKLKEKGEALGRARAYEQQLEDERGLIKELAIIRIMGKNKCAATPAEKIVESDPDYMEHRIAQRTSVVTRFRAEAEFWAAKVEATQASLITPDVFALSEEINELTISVLNANDKITEYAGTLKLLREENARLQRELNASRLTHNESITMRLTAAGPGKP
jgi:hypothetical protein